MEQAIVRINVLLALMLSGCTSLVGDTRSVPEVIAASEKRGDPEAGFQRYGPFTFLEKYRVQHEWVQAYPTLGGQGGCGYVWEGFATDSRGHRTPTKVGLNMWEENGVLYQPASPSRKHIESKSDMTRYVLGAHRRPGSGTYFRPEPICSTAYDGIGNIFNLYLKKITLEKMRADDEAHSNQMRYAKLLEPIKYESTRFAGLPAEKMTELVALGLKGRENDPIPWRTEEIRVPIGDTGYVYQLAFTLSDTIVQNEPEKAARRRAYWQRIQDSFRIEALN